MKQLTDKEKELWERLQETSSQFVDFVLLNHPQALTHARADERRRCIAAVEAVTQQYHVNEDGRGYKITLYKSDYVDAIRKLPIL